MSWGAIGGAAVVTAGGALLGGGSSGGGQQVSQVGQDFNLQGGLFDTSFRKTGQQTNDGVKTYRGNIQNNSISDPRLQAISDQGLVGGQQFLGAAQNDPRALQAEQLSGNFLNSLGSSDAMGIAQQQFDLLNPILQDQQQQDFLGQEQRLFAQGRLGGAGELGGQAQQNALFDSQLDAERKLLFESLGQGQQTQQHQFNMAGGLSNLGSGIRSNNFNLGQGFLNIPLQLQEAMLNQAQVAGGLGGGNIARSQGGGGLNPVQTVGAGLLNSGVQGLTQGVGSIFNNNSQDFSAFQSGNNNINGNINTVGR